MDSSLETAEKIAAKGATAPRVSLEGMKAKIEQTFFATGNEAFGDRYYDVTTDEMRPAHPSLKILTICVLVMRNGFTIIGKSAPASPANFDPEKGRLFAYEDAIRQLWPLEGYALRERLTGAADAGISSGPRG